MSAIRTQTPGNYPKRNKLHLEHGKSLKTRISSAAYIFQRSFAIHAVFIFIFDVLGCPVQSTSRMSVQPFSNSQDHSLMCCTLIIQSSYTSTNCPWLSIGGNLFHTSNWITLQNDSWYQAFNVIDTTYQLISWLTESCVICCILPLMQLLPPAKQ